jgi:hypothetical protein
MKHDNTHIENVDKKKGNQKNYRNIPIVELSAVKMYTKNSFKCNLQFATNTSVNQCWAK